jgi:hypothetical protein
MEYIDKTIEELRTKISEKEAELVEMKKTVNQLCKVAQLSPIYTTEVEPEKTSIGLLRGDEYYMQPIARVIGWILERRKVAGAGPATVEEIYEVMKAGGYKFDSKDDVDAMRGISISMSKNVAKFHRLPSGKFGLTDWYELKEKKQAENNKEETATENKQSQQEEPKRPRGRPKKVVLPETKKEEPKEQGEQI